MWAPVLGASFLCFPLLPVKPKRHSYKRAQARKEKAGQEPALVSPLRCNTLSCNIFYPATSSCMISLGMPHDDVGPGIVLLHRNSMHV